MYLLNYMRVGLNSYKKLILRDFKGVSVAFLFWICVTQS